MVMHVVKRSCLTVFSKWCFFSELVCLFFGFHLINFVDALFFDACDIFSVLDSNCVILFYYVAYLVRTPSTPNSACQNLLCL